MSSKIILLSIVVALSACGSNARGAAVERSVPAAGATVAFALEPALIGEPNTLTVRIRGARPKVVTVALDMPSMPMGGKQLALAAVSGDTFATDVSFGMGGTWRAMIRLDGEAPVPVDFAVRER